MKVIILGSAAGGGFPQWNCGCANCHLARIGDPRATPRTQAGFAVSQDDQHWLLIGASPDLRQQILQTAVLAPRSLRHSPIGAVVLLSADIDGLAGLLTLREQHEFTIFAPAPILEILQQNQIFASLNSALVRRVALMTEAPPVLWGGLQMRLWAMPGKTPLYQEKAGATEAEPAPSFAVQLAAEGRRMVAAPACAALTPEVVARLAEADLLLFDGTLYHDDEMIRAGLSAKTGLRMGHVAISGGAGSLRALAKLRSRKVFVHINNSNPILIAGSAERHDVETAGFEVGWDGMEIEL